MTKAGSRPLLFSLELQEVETKTQNHASPNQKSKAKNRRRWILQQISQTGEKPGIVRYKNQKNELKDDQKQLNRKSPHHTPLALC